MLTLKTAQRMLKSTMERYMNLSNIAIVIAIFIEQIYSAAQKELRQVNSNISAVKLAFKKEHFRMFIIDMIR